MTRSCRRRRREEIVGRKRENFFDATQAVGREKIENCETLKANKQVLCNVSLAQAACRSNKRRREQNMFQLIARLLIVWKLKAERNFLLKPS